ncbi:DUF3558 family protein [Amycolatopsis keratiniphila]|uniref:DUF3558 domain-containing protein n=1 Tax=Amycolatopsis keratiniphila subsp. keratiniphila TaxID=227715 RepID=A0A1W2LSA4_9PSEU|nr:DUF3558 family protein [Amycolatopsis keratiniphila]ONF66996.1 hypothetical protein AVR91_0223945 [Amycolatopsis keratiniphila subsp. keratiniphila]
MKTNVRSAAIPAILAITLTSSGCSPEKAGTPSPAPTSTSTASSPQTASPEKIFGDLKACTLLEPVTTSKGFSKPTEEDYESDNGCQAQKSEYGVISTYLVDEAGLDELTPGRGTKTATQIAGRDAVEIPGSGGTHTCMVGVAVGPKARMTVGTTLVKGSNEEACASSREVAGLLAPKLPQGS